MSGKGAPLDLVLSASGRRLGVVAGRWHGEIVDALLEGARDSVRDLGVRFDEYRVPGAFEIPVALARLAPRYDGLVALGVVMRGGTPHFDYVCRAVTDGCLRVSLDTGKPVGFGILTVDDDAQARARLDKGREAVYAVLETLAVLEAR